ncbi:MAG: prolipoprotein diacylglyceryl transferase [Lachnospiraceae bacterium]|nr:prolipoprotein diacylglyceryl transferase [Lachnospiraceae bacterium]
MDIRFPHLGIELEHVGRSLTIGGFSIAFYGIVIAIGMMCGYFLVSWQAKRTGQNPEIYLDLAVWDIIFAVLGARIYYVLFSWDYYSRNPGEILNIRGGGMAIYGGVIAGVLTTFVFAKVRKRSFLLLVDTACAGLLVGQIIGRWGNFFNREAFGGYTNGLFAMQIPKTDVAVSSINRELLSHIAVVNGIEYIQVHPTFLYELSWNLVVLVLILWFTPKKKYDGQLFLMYLGGYGLGRLWIEGLRTDQLQILNTGIAVSQVLSGTLVVFAVGMSVFQFLRGRKSLQDAGGETSSSGGGKSQI